MHGFTHVKTLDVHYFVNPKLGFVIKLLPDGSGAFTLTRLGDYVDPNVVTFPAPSENMLGAYYQPNFPRLGYEVAWFSNCAHELLHIWYCNRYENRLSRNHGMLMGLHGARISECDDEERMVTALQVFANTGIMLPPVLSRRAPTVTARLAKQFHDWIARCVARPVGAACLLASCQTENKPDRV